MVPPNIEPPAFSQICERISLERRAVEWQLRLMDPSYRAFLVDLFRLALTDDDSDDS